MGRKFESKDAPLREQHGQARQLAETDHPDQERASQGNFPNRALDLRAASQTKLPREEAKNNGTKLHRADLQADCSRPWHIHQSAGAHYEDERAENQQKE